MGLLKSAKEQGAEVILGDVTRKGSVVRPHLIFGVRPGMELWKRESFGPSECVLVSHFLSLAQCGVNPTQTELRLRISVLAITPVDTVDEAVELANDSDYTLVASLWTTNVYNAFEVGGRIRAGEVSTNHNSYNFVSLDFTLHTFPSCSGSVNINGPTMNSEAGEGQAGLGYVEHTITVRSVQSDPSNFYLGVIYSGTSGYGKFNVESFTDRRSLILHAEHRSYPFMGLT